MARDTRKRIMETARRLFNEYRYGNITTAALAAEVGIAEGNLWYHFKTKRSLFEALNEEFIAFQKKRLQLMPTEAGDCVAEFAEFLLCTAEEMRRFRFIFRDQADFGEHADPLLEQLPDIYAQSHDQLYAFLKALIDNDLLDWPLDQLNSLVTNVIMVLRYNLEFQREMGVAQDVGTGAIEWGLMQQVSLYEHKMSPKAAHQLKQMLKAGEAVRRDSPSLAEAV